MRPSFLCISGDGGIGDWTSTGWQPWFSDEGFSKSGGEFGTGDTLHITAFPNASLDFIFYGRCARSDLLLLD